MRFEVRKPCSNCPFRNDKPELKGWLGKERAQEIADLFMKHEKVFPCHKHLNAGPTNRQACAGALFMIENLKPNNFLIRFAIAQNMYKPEKLNLSKKDLVFKSVEEFVDFHT